MKTASSVCQACDTPVPQDAAFCPTCGAPTPADRSGSVPDDAFTKRFSTAVAERYAVVREIGRGGMAVVYLAQDRKLDRYVALKVLRPEVAAALGADRFVREIEVAAKLSHPNILALHDCGEADGHLYYTMPYLDGESLRDLLIREKQLRVEDALRITREVADALSHAHALGIVHRDIKPENILFHGEHAVVADFGIARALTEAGSPRLTETGLAIGTPAYMSPEQATGSADVDARSDIYSLACVLYEMLSGEMLYTGPSARAVIAKVLSLPPTPIRMLRPRVPDPVERALLVALDKSAVDRFATAEEFVEALEEGVLSESGAIRPMPSGAARGSSWPVGRVIAVVAATSAGALALLSIIGLLTTVAYDVKMQLPPEYTPSRTDFPVVGLRAATPSLLLGVAVVVATLILKYGARIGLFILGRVFNLGPTLDGWTRGTTAQWRRLWGSVRTTTIAEVFLVTAVAASLGVLVLYRRLFIALWSEDPTALSCSSRWLHESYTVAMVLLMGAIALGWIGVSRYLRRRQARGISFSLVRWGGLVWIVLLVLITTMPWRLLYLNHHPRALVNGERGYILLDRDADLVIYNAERRSTGVYPKDGPLEVEPLNSIGYVFESAEQFATNSGC